jgi:hypothetical protein
MNKTYLKQKYEQKNRVKRICDNIDKMYFVKDILNLQKYRTPCFLHITCNVYILNVPNNDNICDV